MVSDANDTLHRVFDRVGLTSAVAALFDSCAEGIKKPIPVSFNSRSTVSRQTPPRLSTWEIYFTWTLSAPAKRASS